MTVENYLSMRYNNKKDKGGDTNELFPTKIPGRQK